MSRARDSDEYQHKGEKKINENAGFDFFSSRKMCIRKRNIMEEWQIDSGFQRCLFFWWRARFPKKEKNHEKAAAAAALKNKQISSFCSKSMIRNVVWRARNRSRVWVDDDAVVVLPTKIYTPNNCIFMEKIGNEQIGMRSHSSLN